MDEKFVSKDAKKNDFRTKWNFKRGLLIALTGASFNWYLQTIFEETDFYHGQAVLCDVIATTPSLCGYAAADVRFNPDALMPSWVGYLTGANASSFILKYCRTGSATSVVAVFTGAYVACRTTQKLVSYLMRR